MRTPHTVVKIAQNKSKIPCFVSTNGFDKCPNNPSTVLLMPLLAPIRSYNNFNRKSITVQKQI